MVKKNLPSDKQEEYLKARASNVSPSDTSSHRLDFSTSKPPENKGAIRKVVSSKGSDRSGFLLRDSPSKHSLLLLKNPINNEDEENKSDNELDQYQGRIGSAKGITNNKWFASNPFKGHPTTRKEKKQFQGISGELGSKTQNDQSNSDNNNRKGFLNRNQSEPALDKLGIASKLPSFLNQKEKGLLEVEPRMTQSSVKLTSGKHSKKPSGSDEEERISYKRTANSAKRKILQKADKARIEVIRLSFETIKRISSLLEKKKSIQQPRTQSVQAVLVQSIHDFQDDRFAQESRKSKDLIEVLHQNHEETLDKVMTHSGTVAGKRNPYEFHPITEEQFPSNNSIPSNRKRSISGGRKTPSTPYKKSFKEADDLDQGGDGNRSPLESGRNSKRGSKETRTNLKASLSLDNRSSRNYVRQPPSIPLKERPKANDKILEQIDDTSSVEIAQKFDNSQNEFDKELFTSSILNRSMNNREDKNKSHKIDLSHQLSKDSKFERLSGEEQLFDSFLQSNKTVLEQKLSAKNKKNSSKVFTEEKLMDLYDTSHPRTNRRVGLPPGTLRDSLSSKAYMQVIGGLTELSSISRVGHSLKLAGSHSSGSTVQQNTSYFLHVVHNLLARSNRRAQRIAFAKLAEEESDSGFLPLMITKRPIKSYLNISSSFSVIPPSPDTSFLGFGSQPSDSKSGTLRFNPADSSNLKYLTKTLNYLTKNRKRLAFKQLKNVLNRSRRAQSSLVAFRLLFNRHCRYHLNTSFHSIMNAALGIEHAIQTKLTAVERIRSTVQAVLSKNEADSLRSSFMLLCRQAHAGVLENTVGQRRRAEYRFLLRVLLDIETAHVRHSLFALKAWADFVGTMRQLGKNNQLKALVESTQRRVTDMMNAQKKAAYTEIKKINEQMAYKGLAFIMHRQLTRKATIAFAILMKLGFQAKEELMMKDLQIRSLNEDNLITELTERKRENLLLGLVRSQYSKFYIAFHQFLSLHFKEKLNSFYKASKQRGLHLFFRYLSTACHQKVKDSYQALARLLPQQIHLPRLASCLRSLFRSQRLKTGQCLARLRFTGLSVAHTTMQSDHKYTLASLRLASCLATLSHTTSNANQSTLGIAFGRIVAHGSVAVLERKLHQQLLESEAQEAATRAEFEDMEKMLVEEQRMLEDLHASKLALEARLAEAQRKTADTADVGCEVALADEENGELRKQLEAAKDELAQVEEVRDLLVEQRDKLATEAEEVEAKVKNMESELRETKEEIEKIKLEKESAVKEWEDALKRVEEMEAEKEVKMEELEAKQAEINRKAALLDQDRLQLLASVKQRELNLEAGATALLSEKEALASERLAMLGSIKTREMQLEAESQRLSDLESQLAADRLALSGEHESSKEGLAVREAEILAEWEKLRLERQDLQAAKEQEREAVQLLRNQAAEEQADFRAKRAELLAEVKDAELKVQREIAALEKEKERLKSDAEELEGERRKICDERKTLFAGLEEEKKRMNTEYDQRLEVLQARETSLAARESTFESETTTSLAKLKTRELQAERQKSELTSQLADLNTRAAAISQAELSLSELKKQAEIERQNWIETQKAELLNLDSQRLSLQKQLESIKEEEVQRLAKIKAEEMILKERTEEFEKEKTEILKKKVEDFQTLVSKEDEVNRTLQAIVEEKKRMESTKVELETLQSEKGIFLANLDSSLKEQSSVLAEQQAILTSRIQHLELAESNAKKLAEELREAKALYEEDKAKLDYLKSAFDKEVTLRHSALEAGESRLAQQIATLQETELSLRADRQQIQLAQGSLLETKAALERREQVVAQTESSQNLREQELAERVQALEAAEISFKSRQQTQSIEQERLSSTLQARLESANADLHKLVEQHERDLASLNARLADVAKKETQLAKERKELDEKVKQAEKVQIEVDEKLAIQQADRRKEIEAFEEEKRKFEKYKSDILESVKDKEAEVLKQKEVLSEEQAKIEAEKMRMITAIRANEQAVTRQIDAILDESLRAVHTEQNSKPGQTLVGVPSFSRLQDGSPVTFSGADRAERDRFGGTQVMLDAEDSPAFRPVEKEGASTMVSQSRPHSRQVSGMDEYLKASSQLLLSKMFAAAQKKETECAIVDVKEAALWLASRNGRRAKGTYGKHEEVPAEEEDNIDVELRIVERRGTSANSSNPLHTPTGSIKTTKKYDFTKNIKDNDIIESRNLSTLSEKEHVSKEFRETSNLSDITGTGAMNEFKYPSLVFEKIHQRIKEINEKKSYPENKKLIIKTEGYNFGKVTSPLSGGNLKNPLAFELGKRASIPSVSYYSRLGSPNSSQMKYSIIDGPISPSAKGLDEGVAKHSSLALFSKKPTRTGLDSILQGQEPSSGTKPQIDHSGSKVTKYAPNMPVRNLIKPRVNNFFFGKTSHQVRNRSSYKGAFLLRSLHRLVNKRTRTALQRLHLSMLAAIAERDSRHAKPVRLMMIAQVLGQLEKMKKQEAIGFFEVKSKIRNDPGRKALADLRGLRSKAFAVVGTERREAMRAHLNELVQANQKNDFSRQQEGDSELGTGFIDTDKEFLRNDAIGELKEMESKALEFEIGVISRIRSFQKIEFISDKLESILKHLYFQRLYRNTMAS